MPAQRVGLTYGESWVTTLKKGCRKTISFADFGWPTVVALGGCEGSMHCLGRDGWLDGLLVCIWMGREEELPPNCCAAFLQRMHVIFAYAWLCGVVARHCGGVMLLLCCCVWCVVLFLLFRHVFDVFFHVFVIDVIIVICSFLDNMWSLQQPWGRIHCGTVYTWARGGPNYQYLGGTTWPRRILRSFVVWDSPW